MSRSYKKHPICKDNNKSKSVGKSIANDAVRTYIKKKMNGDDDFTMPANKKYVKLYCQWEIADYVSRYSREQCIRDYYNCKNSQRKWERKLVENKTLEEWLNDWKKYYKRK